MAANLEKKLQSKLKLELLKLEDAERALDRNYSDQIKLQMDRVTNAINQLSAQLDSVLEAMAEEEKTMVSIKACKDTHLAEIEKFTETQMKLSDRLDELTDLKDARTNATLQARIKIEQELEEARGKLIDGENIANPSSLKYTQTVKLQKYTITPFRGDYKDWLRFWNQFSVEIDKSGIAEISKFNYLLELVKDKPRDDILGLPHTEQGYEEAKRILVETYGKNIKVHKAIIMEIQSLHSINSRIDSSKVHDFYNKLSRCVRTLKTMNKLDSAQALVYSLMDKLGPVREVLAQNDDDWENWGLKELVENLRKYVDRNPITKQFQRVGSDDKNDRKIIDEKLYNTISKEDVSSKDFKKGCLYCDENHQSSECSKLKTVEERKAVFIQKRLCFNCGGQHRVFDCKSTRTCRHCKAKHHTSICDRISDNVDVDPMMLTPKKGVIYPVAIGRVNGLLCRIFLDTGTGSRYASSKLIQIAKPKYVGKVDKKVDMLLHSTNQSFEQYELTIENLKGDFEMKVCVNKVSKQEILQLENPRYNEVIERHEHLTGVSMIEESDKDYLPVHLILGSGDFAKLKTKTVPKIGKKPDDPVAELTKLGWIMYSSGVEDEVSRINFINSSNLSVGKDSKKEPYVKGTDVSIPIKDGGVKPSQESNGCTYAKPGFRSDVYLLQNGTLQSSMTNQTEHVDSVNSHAFCDTRHATPDIHSTTQQGSCLYQDMVAVESRQTKEMNEQSPDDAQDANLVLDSRGEEKLPTLERDAKGENQRCIADTNVETAVKLNEVESLVILANEMEIRKLHKSVVVTHSNTEVKEIEVPESEADSTPLAINSIAESSLTNFGRAAPTTVAKILFRFVAKNPTVTIGEGNPETVAEPTYDNVGKDTLKTDKAATDAPANKGNGVVEIEEEVRISITDKDEDKARKLLIAKHEKVLLMTLTRKHKSSSNEYAKQYNEALHKARLEAKLLWIDDAEEMPILTSRIHSLEMWENYLKRWKDCIWKRWCDENLRGLKEQCSVVQNCNNRFVGCEGLVQGQLKGAVEPLLCTLSSILRPASRNANNQWCSESLYSRYAFDEEIRKVIDLTPSV